MPIKLKNVKINHFRRLTEMVYLGIAVLLLSYLIILGGCGTPKNPEKRKGYLQIEFKAPSNSFQLLRHMGYAPSGGADIGECLYVAEQIKEGDMRSWHDEWARAANRLLSFSLDAIANDHIESAKEGLFRSCNYFLASEFFLPKGTQKLEIFEQARDCFIRASQLSHLPFQQIQIPYENTYLPGYIYLTNSPQPTKTIILNTGYDGNAEELYFDVGFYAQKRGYNVVIFEGPGQGLPLRKQNLPFRPDWEKVIQSVVDFTLSFKEVDPNRLALYGRSFGGYLTPRSAAYEKRIKALIVNSPINDFLLVMEKHGLPTNLAKENPQKFDQTMFAEMKHSPKLNYLIEEGMWKIGGATPSEWVSNLGKYQLSNEAELIECPTLVVDSDQDHMIERDQAKIFYDRLKCPKKMVLFTEETGAALHCQMGGSCYANEVIFDWLDQVFAEVQK